MGNHIAESQSANILPPRSDGILAMTLDNTSRRKRLDLIDINDADVTKGGEVFLTLYADVKFWFRFAETDAGTVDETAADAAATTTPTYQANAGWEVPASTEVHVRIHRKTDKVLIVKGSAAGTLRVRPSSDTTGR